jgi:hypothetical protein
MLAMMRFGFSKEVITEVENGSESADWYLTIPFRGIWSKIRSRLAAK